MYLRSPHKVPLMDARKKKKKKSIIPHQRIPNPSGLVGSARFRKSASAELRRCPVPPTCCIAAVILFLHYYFFFFHSSSSSPRPLSSSVDRPPRLTAPLQSHVLYSQTHVAQSRSRILSPFFMIRFFFIHFNLTPLPSIAGRGSRLVG